MVLEHLFWTGRITAQRRPSDFARIYDLTERVIPASALAVPTPPEREARTDLLVLAASHLVCLPSYYGEGIPKSLIEAAAAGRPIVTTDMPGCREVVSDGRNGYLVPPRDAEALANALERLSTNAELRRRMGSEGRRRAEESFGLEAVIQQTLSLYEEALK